MHFKQRATRSSPFHAVLQTLRAETVAQSGSWQTDSALQHHDEFPFTSDRFRPKISVMKRTEYPVLLKAAAEGGFVVTCRDLPQLITQGEDLADALAQAADAMHEVFATYMLEGIKFPAPSVPTRNERMVSPRVRPNLNAE